MEEPIKPLPPDLPPDMPEAKPFFKSAKERTAWYEWYVETVGPGLKKLDEERRQMEEEFYNNPTRFC